jgi:hypothetical protein
MEIFNKNESIQINNMNFIHLKQYQDATLVVKNRWDYYVENKEIIIIKQILYTERPCGKCCHIQTKVVLMFNKETN